MLNVFKNNQGDKTAAQASTSSAIDKYGMVVIASRENLLICILIFVHLSFMSLQQ